MESTETQEGYEASLEEERDFKLSLREHVEKNFIDGLLLTPAGVSRVYIMVVSAISRLDMLALGKFHVSIEKITGEARPHKIQLTLKRI